MVLTNLYTQFEVVRLLKSTAEALGSQSALAKKIGISRQNMSETIKMKRPPGPKVLAFLGLERKVMYQGRTLKDGQDGGR